MGNRYLIPRLLSPLAAFATLGCQVMHPPVPVTVQIRDAETKAPIPGASVAFTYPVEPASHPHNASGTTGSDGIVQIRAATGEDAIPQVKIDAPNYLPEVRGLPGGTLHAIKEVGLFGFGSSNKAPIEVILDVYSGPQPTVELILPNGYRGLVKAEVRVREEVAYPPGQRTFSVNVPADGVVQVEGPAVLRQGKGPVFRAAYADGTQLASEVQDAEVGLRWLRCEGRVEIFVIGTRDEWVNFRKAVDKGTAPGSSSGKSGGQGGQGKGGGRRGGGGGP